MKKITTLLLLVLGFSGSLKAQLNIQLSEITKPRGYFNGFYPISENDFYTVRSVGMMGQTTELSRYSNYQEITTQKVKMTVGTGFAKWESSAMVDKKVIVFFSDKIAEGDAKKNNLYLQKYNEECLPDGAPKLLSSIDIQKAWKKAGSYSVLNSTNQEFFCIEYDIPGNKDENDRFVYKIFSKNFDLIQEGEYEVPYASRISSISRRYLSNTGDYFISCNVYDIGDKKKVKDLASLDKVILLHIKKDGIEEMEMEIDGRRAMEMNYSSDGKGIMTFTGLYGEKKDRGIKGIFYYRYDFNNKKLIDSGFEPFSKDFITSDWNDKQKAKAQKKEDKGKGAPQLYNYEIRGLLTQSDGSIVGLMEQYWVQVITSTDPKTGATSTTYIYHYEDLIVYKIQKNGTFDWVKKMPKTQISGNDGGFLSSVSSFMKDGKMMIIFNDNRKNYDLKGDYNGENVQTSYSKKTSVVAYAEVDLESGDIIRKLVFGPEVLNQYAVPKSFEVDLNTNQVWMMFRPGKKKFQFGKLAI